MTYEGIKVLVLDGAGRQTLPILCDLHKLQCHITVVCSSKLDVGYSSRYPDVKLLSPTAIYEEDMQTGFINQEIASGKYDVLMPLSDLSTQHISMHLDKYLKYVKTFVQSYEVFMMAYDKQKIMDVCMKSGIPCTLTKRHDERYDDFIKKTGYPIVAKPRSSCGSMGFSIIKDQYQWNEFISKVDIDDYVVQEYVEQNGKQYNVHIFMNTDGEATFSVATEKCRWFPVDGGASCFCRTINRPDLVEQCEKLLRAIEWKGYCDIDLIEDVNTKEDKIIEINGRASANIKICQLQGINVALNMLELTYGKKETMQQKAYSDKRMRCIHTDLLWLIKSKKHFLEKLSWFNCRHTRDQIFSTCDPVPFLTFSVKSILNYKKEMKKRSR